MFPGENNNNNKSTNKGLSYVIAAGIVFIEILFSATWLPFGVFYIELLKLGIASKKELLWIPTVVISIRTICNPLSRKLCEYFNDNDYDNYRYVITITTLTTAVAIILGACSKLILIQTLTYGVFCGISSSLISNQLKETTYETLQSKPQLFEGLQQVAKALSLFLVPHMFHYLVTNYTIYEAEFLFAAFFLHIIPVSLIIKLKQHCTKPNISRYKTLSTLYTQKIATLSNLSTSETTEDSSSDDEDELNIIDLEATTNTVIVVNPVVPCYRKNTMGVDILPEIPEEDEIEEKSENIPMETMKDSISQYSQLSARFEDLINNSHHNIASMPYVSNENQRFCLKRYMKCSPYKKYLYKKRLNRITDFFCEILWLPLWKALRIFLFYQCLLTKILTTLTPTIYVVFVPYTANTIEDVYSTETPSAESAMLLSLIAFPWLCFLIFLPWLINSSKNKLTIIFCSGIVILGFSTFLVNLRVNYDVIAIASLLFGVAYGGIELTRDIVFKEAAGLQQWRKIRDPLDIISGLLIIILYAVISVSDVDILRILGGSTVVSMLLVSVWMFIFFKDKIYFGLNLRL